MQFTDFTFLFGFFPLAWILYHFVPRKFQNLFLLAASLIFYSLGSIQNLLILLFVLIWNYVSARQIESEEVPAKRKRELIISAAVNVLVLLFYKYLFFWIGSLSTLMGIELALDSPAIPIGLSFYIFSSLSALFDIYRKEESLCSPVNFGLFVAFFGWVNMGPVAHYNLIEPQLDNHPITSAKLKEGAALFLQGLVYKVLLANNFALIYEGLLDNPTWLGTAGMALAYFFDLYFDFCGYSRMARGAASCFGFTVPKNFNHPYRALTIQDYWRRWHISLTSWFRSYVYIPLGGNRVSFKRWILNVLVVWVLTGLWHGASYNFLLWGLYQALFLIMEKKWLNSVMERIPEAIRHIYVWIVAIIGDIFLSAATGAAALQAFGRIFGIGISGFVDAQSAFLLVQSFWLFMIGFIVVSPIPESLAAALQERYKAQAGWLTLSGYALALVICIAFLTAQTAQTFLYAVF